MPFGVRINPRSILGLFRSRRNDTMRLLGVGPRFLSRCVFLSSSTALPGYTAVLRRDGSVHSRPTSSVNRLRCCRQSDLSTTSTPNAVLTNTGNMPQPVRAE